MLDLVILAAAGFCAGILNTIAGGGTFLTLPAPVFTGIPPVAANATSAVAVFSGYLSGALGFRRELQDFNRNRLLRLTAVTLAGGLVGSILLLVSSDKAFPVVVPFLLLVTTLAFLFGEPLRQWAAEKGRAVTPFGASGLFAISVYGEFSMAVQGSFC